MLKENLKKIKENKIFKIIISIIQYIFLFVSSLWLIMFIIVVFTNKDNPKPKGNPIENWKKFNNSKKLENK